MVLDVVAYWIGDWPLLDEDPARLLRRVSLLPITLGSTSPSATGRTCLGMHLARLETRVLLNAVLDRLPGLRLNPAAQDTHIHGLVFRSPRTCPCCSIPGTGEFAEQWENGRRHGKPVLGRCPPNGRVARCVTPAIRHDR